MTWLLLAALLADCPILEDVIAREPDPQLAAHTATALACLKQSHSDGFTQTPAQGGGVWQRFDEAGHRRPGTHVQWQGRCVSLATAPADHHNDRVPKVACLTDAHIVERPVTSWWWPHLERAARLHASPEHKAAWQTCRAQDTAERCADRIEPLRSEEPVPAREARCQLTAQDAQQRLAVFQCGGSLVEAHCAGETSPIFKILTEQAFLADQLSSCSDDGLSIQLIAQLPTPATSACRSAAQRALASPQPAFAAARTAALTACADGVDAAPTKTEAGLWVERVLVRQRRLFGALRVAPPCQNPTTTCRRNDEASALLRQVDRGCGRSVVELFPLDEWGYGDGSFSAGDSRRLLLTDARHWREVAMFDDDNSVKFSADWREGNLFGAPQTAHTEIFAGTLHAAAPTPDPTPVPAPDPIDATVFLISETLSDDDFQCIEEQFNRPRTIYPSYEPVDATKATAALRRQWPQLTRMAAGWQRDIRSGSMRDVWAGETAREHCELLVRDACSGDIVQYCAATLGEDETCTGTLTRAGRCGQYRWQRLTADQ